MTIAATPDQIASVAGALGRASLFDNRIGDGDAARAAAWAESIAPYGFDRAELLQAVTAHYRAEPMRTITPADLIRLARESRRDRAEREPAQDREMRQLGNDHRHGLTPPDAQLGGLPIAGADGDPVWAAYDINGAIDRGCPTCKEPAGGACVNPRNDQARKIPCLARLKTPKTA